MSPLQLLFLFIAVITVKTSHGAGVPLPRPDALMAQWPLTSYYKMRDVGPHGLNGTEFPGASASISAGPFGDASSSMRSSEKGIFEVGIDEPEKAAKLKLDSSFTIAFYMSGYQKLGAYCSGILSWFNTDGVVNTTELNYCHDVRVDSNTKTLRYEIELHTYTSKFYWLDFLEPKLWNFVALTFNVDTCMLSVYNQYGLVYQPLRQDGTCWSLKNGINNNGFRLGESTIHRWQPNDVAFSCLSLYKAELTLPEIFQLQSYCRQLVGSQPCAGPRLPDIPLVPPVPARSAKNGEFPAVVSIRYGSAHACTGTIVAPHWVLTSASCFVSTIKDQYTVIAGEFDIAVEEVFERKHLVANINKHPNYANLGSNKGTVNDIALIELKSPIDFSHPYVTDTCLPWTNFPADLTKDSYYSVGFGLNGRSEFASSTIIRYGVGRIDTSATCQASWGSTFNASSMFCFQDQSFQGQIPCTGDEGAPIYQKPIAASGVLEMQVGIYTGRGGKECETGLSAGKLPLYTRIDAYLTSWIYKTIGCTQPGFKYTTTCPGGEPAGHIA